MESLHYHFINMNKKRDLENHLNNLYDKKNHKGHRFAQGQNGSMKVKKILNIS